MNLIPCSESCIHQKDGYCGFDEAGVISQQLGTPVSCMYFAERQPKAHLEKLPAENLHRLKDV